MSRTTSYRRWFFSDNVVKTGDLPSHLLEAIHEMPAILHDEAEQDLVVMLGSEILAMGPSSLPEWTGPSTRYLVLLDIPERAVMRLPTALSLHKPDQRLYITRDRGSVKRALIGLHRAESWEGIIDAYVYLNNLVVLLADFSIREFPKSRLPGVCQLGEDAFPQFEIDSSGSYLYWEDLDVHLGPSQLLQAVDPMHLADVEIQRYAMEKISLVLLDMRRERDLTQSDIAGLSERQVRRLENEESRFTADAAGKYAEVFDLTLSDFLQELSRRVSTLRDEDAVEEPTVEELSTSDATAGYGSGAQGAPPPNSRRVASSSS